MKLFASVDTMLGKRLCPDRIRFSATRSIAARNVNISNLIHKRRYDNCLNIMLQTSLELQIPLA